MAEYIGREAFKKSVEERYCKPCKAEGKDHNGCWCRACWVDDMLDEVDCFQPSDVAPVVHGRWEWFDEDTGTPFTGYEREWGWRCSRCKHELPDDYDDPDYRPMLDYCPNCGAKMDEKEGKDG